MAMLDQLLAMMSGQGAADPRAAMFSGQADAELMPPSANDPQAREPVVYSGGVPMPRPRPVTPNTPASVAPTDASSSTPLSLAPSAPAPVAATEGQGGGLGSLLGGLLKPENAPLFLSLAGGFSGAGSLGSGMRRAFAGATPAAMQLQQQQKTLTSQQATFRALRERGVPPHEALASVLDPNIMKATVTKYFETRPAQIVNNRLVREKPGGGVELLADYSDDKDKPRQQITVKNAAGTEMPVSFDPKTGKYFDVGGKELSAADLSSGGTDIYKALIDRGVPEVEAKAALSNPEIMKAVSMRAFGTKALTHVMKEDAFGNKVPMSFDPNSGKYYDENGRPLLSDTAEVSSQSRSGAAAGPLGGGEGGLGMSGPINSDLVGDEYLGQFPKEVQSAVRNYVRGDSMPTGNPRKGFVQAVKMIAQKYGEDTGVPVSDQKYVERRQYRNQLASGNAGVGAQRNALRQGLEHLEGVTESAGKLGNWDLGVTWLTAPTNTVRGWSTEQQSKVNDMKNKVQQLAGEMGKFFSGSAGGGVHEREETRKRFDAVSSPQELAAAIESSLELLEGGLHAREQQRDEILGPNSGVEILSAKDKERVARIREMAVKLRGGGNGGAGSGAKPAAPSGKTGAGVSWSIVQ